MKDWRGAVGRAAGVPRPAAVGRRDETQTGDIDVVADERKASFRKERQVGAVVLELLLPKRVAHEAFDGPRHTTAAAAEDRIAGQRTRACSETLAVGHGRAKIECVAARQRQRVGSIGDAREHRAKSERSLRLHAGVERCLAVLNGEVVEPERAILTQVIPGERDFAACKRERRHDLVPSPGVVVGELWRRPVLTAHGCRHDNARITLRLSGAKWRKAAGGPRQIETAWLSGTSPIRL